MANDKSMDALVKSINNLVEKMDKSTRSKSTTDTTGSTKEENVLHKMYVKTMTPAVGKWASKSFEFTKKHIQTYFSKLTTVASGLMNKMFGKMIEDLRPIIDTMKATASFVLGFFKKLGGMIAGALWSSIKAMWGGGKWLAGLFNKKPEEVIAKEAKKQTNYLKRIDTSARKIVRNTKIKTRTNVKDRVSSLTGSMFGLNNRKAIRERRAEAAASGQSTESGGLLSGFSGGIISGLTGIFTGGLKAIGGLAGLLPIVGPLLAAALPVLIGGGLVASLTTGLWSMFEEKFPEQAKWVDNNIKKPFVDFWTNTAYPFIEKTMVTMGSVISEAISRGFGIIYDKIFGGGLASKASDDKKKAAELRSSAERSTDPTEKDSLLQQANILEAKSDAEEKYNKRRTRGTKYATIAGATAGMMAAGPIGSIVVAGFMNRVANSAYDYFQPAFDKKTNTAPSILSPKDANASVMPSQELYSGIQGGYTGARTGKYNLSHITVASGGNIPMQQSWLSKGMINDQVSSTKSHNFLNFTSPEANKAATEELLQKSYGNMDVNTAMTKWSGKGLDKGELSALRGQTINDIIKSGQFDTLYAAIVKREGNYANTNNYAKGLTTALKWNTDATKDNTKEFTKKKGGIFDAISSFFSQIKDAFNDVAENLSPEELSKGISDVIGGNGVTDAERAEAERTSAINGMIGDKTNTTGSPIFISKGGDNFGGNGGGSNGGVSKLEDYSDKLKNLMIMYNY